MVSLQAPFFVHFLLFEHFSSLVATPPQFVFLRYFAKLDHDASQLAFFKKLLQIDNQLFVHVSKLF